jgi:predicted nucleic acid-binding protein
LAELIDTSLLAGGRAPAELPEEWVVSVVSVGELEAGILRAPAAPVRAARLARLAAVLDEAPVIPIDRAVAVRYGELRAASGRKPTNDLWIAATALAHDFTLLTADRDQARLPLVRVTLVS